MPTLVCRALNSEAHGVGGTRDELDARLAGAHVKSRGTKPCNVNLHVRVSASERFCENANLDVHRLLTLKIP